MDYRLHFEMLVNTVFICQTTMLPEKLSVGDGFNKNFLIVSLFLLLTFGYASFKKKKIYRHTLPTLQQPLRQNAFGFKADVGYP